MPTPSARTSRRRASGRSTVERDEGPVEEGRAQSAAAAVRPVDAGPEGPTESADEPGGDTTDEESAVGGRDEATGAT